MKLFYKTILTLLVTIPCITSAKAYDFEDNGIYYNILANNCVEVTHDNNASTYYGDVIIPSSVNYNGITYSVTTIGVQAFFVCDFLHSVVIPESVTTIRKLAFEHCNWLTSIDIPNSVTTIDRYAFSYCPSLTSINVGLNNNNYTSVDGILYNKDVTKLICCPRHKKGYVDIPASVTLIGNDAFYGCSSLTSIKIPNSVTSIGEYAFNGCSSLTSINMPLSITAIEKNTFTDCSSLTSIKITDSVTSIGEYAFQGCSSLISFKIPNSVTSIGRQSFAQCSSLTSIKIPNSVTSIGAYAFAQCSSLTAINVEQNNRNYTSSDGILYDKAKTTIICCPIGKSVNIYIPNSVTSIENSAFQGCNLLTSVDIPNSVTSIGGYAFDNCTSLTSIKIPDSVTSIGMCGFTNCPLLTLVTCYSKIIPEIGYNCFSAISDFAILSVYDSVLDDYKNSEWGNYFSQILPITTSNINYIVTNKENSIFSVYNLNGVKILTTSNTAELKNLPAAIYIINGKKVMIHK